MARQPDDPSMFGSTFAERKAAREGKKYDKPAQDVSGNSTFASRRKASAKAVSSGDAEDKSVKKTAKKTAKKSSK